MHVDGQRTPRTWLSGMQFSLDSKIQWCIRNVWKRTKIHFQRTGSSRLLRTSTIAIVKDRLCRLSAQHRQQPQPYNKGQLKFTSYKEIRKRTRKKFHFPRQRWNEATRLEQGQLIQSEVSSQGCNMSQLW